MSYAVLLHPKAAKELKKLEASIQAQITARLRDLREKPGEKGKPLSQSDFWSLRAGDYRAIYQIDSARKQVVVLWVGHRSKVYDDFSKML